MCAGPTVELVDKGNGEWKVRMQFSVSISGNLGLNSQSLLLAIDPRQSMRSGFHYAISDLQTRSYRKCPCVSVDLFSMLCEPVRIKHTRF